VAVKNFTVKSRRRPLRHDLMPMTAEGNRSKSNPSHTRKSLQRSYTYKLHLQVTPTSYTYKLHLQVTPTSYTYKLHLQVTPTRKVPQIGHPYPKREVTSRSGHATQGQSSGGTARAPRYPRGEALGSMKKTSAASRTGDEEKEVRNPSKNSSCYLLSNLKSSCQI
jgi:hypothetical protein